MKETLVMNGSLAFLLGLLLVLLWAEPLAADDAVDSRRVQ